MKKFLLLLLCSIAIPVCFSQILDPVKWEYKVNRLNNCEAELVFTAKVDTGWHLFSQKFEPNPLAFDFIAGPYKKVDGVEEPTPFKEYDDVLDWDMYYFTESIVVFKQKIAITSGKAFQVTGKLFGQACQVKQGVCIIVQKDFSFDVSKCIKNTN